MNKTKGVSFFIHLCYDARMNKIFREKASIVAWLRGNSVKNYELIEDRVYGFIVNTYSTVDLSQKYLENISIKFGKVEGNFYCSYNELKTFQGFPDEISGSLHVDHNKIAQIDYLPRVGESINLSFNRIKKLNNIPCIVNGNFYINNNKISNLSGCPKTVKGSFSCTNNKLKSLIDGPDNVGKDFIISHNNLYSLEYMPTVGENIVCENNQLISVLGAPQVVNGDFNVNKNKLSKFENFPHTISGKFEGAFNNFSKNNLIGFPQSITDDIDLRGNKLLEEIQKMYDIKDILPFVEKSVLDSSLYEKSANNKKINKI